MFNSLLKQKLPKSFEVDYYRRDGSHCWIEAHLDFLKEGKKKLGFIAVLRDISERKRMENISKVRGKLREIPSLTIGLNLILETALHDLNMDIGAIFTINSKKNIAQIKQMKSKIKDINIDESYPLTNRYLEFDVLKNKEGISKIVEKGNKSILNMKSIHCTFLHFGREVNGFLSLGSRKKEILNSNDLAILNMYSELASTLFESR